MPRTGFCQHLQLGERRTHGRDTSERPVRRAGGGAGRGLVRHLDAGDGARTTAGADGREVRGETREHFAYVNGAYTRLRVAGGTQDIGGLFVLREQPLGAGLRATVGARLDGWDDRNGHRRESDLATDTASRDDHYAGHDGTAFSPSAGLVWQAASRWRLHANAQQAFRRPTLNELYRPFRAGSVITEANAALRTERVTSAELGADYTQGPLTLGAALFWNDLHDAVGNVTVARGPGTFPLFGPLAAGSIGRERLNIDRTRVRGAELSAEWRPVAPLTLNANFLYDDTTVVSAPVAPALVGQPARPGAAPERHPRRQLAGARRLHLHAASALARAAV